MTKLVFMLTYNDVTVPNAIEVFKEIQDTEVTHIGIKDVGLPIQELRTLMALIRDAGKVIFLEVVSETKEDAMRSVKKAIDLEVDYLIGGTYVEQSLQLLKDRIRFMPYIGKVVGHPCLLRGSVEEIVNDAKRVKALGADGINLLAYRYDGNANNLMTSVKHAVDLPIVVAGSVDSFERIRRVKELAMWGFTIGTAIFEKKFVSDGNLRDQLAAVIREMERPRRQSK
ncbi:MAG: 4-hydroxythreonine-4-phosphate dehydrogenase [Candidatus Bathyarchaeia archaeon]